MGAKAGLERVAGEGELADGERKRIEIDGRWIVLFRVGELYYAIDDLCTHDGGPLGEGPLAGKEVTCPRHGARFDVTTGAALSMPAFEPIPVHEVVLEDGSVFIRVTD